MNCDRCTVQAEMGELRAILERVDKAVSGNGQPGLSQRVGALEAWREAARSVVAAAVWAVGIAVAVSGVLWAALRGK